MLKEKLGVLLQYKTLTRDDARDILLGIAEERYNKSQVVAFLSVYMMRPVTVDELLGFTDALLETCHRIDLSEFDAMDLVGTGGDCKNTFNISTVSTFVVAGAGVHVSKHGNYGVSSGCGSSNVLEALGYKFTNDEATLRRQMEQAGICFLHAPLFSPAMKAVGPIRRELGVKTFFNILGPLVNPSFPKCQMSGVFNLEVGRLYQYLFQRRGIRYCVLHSLDGYDEVSLTGGVKVVRNQGEELLFPEDLKLRTVRPEEIAGGATIEGAKDIFVDLLEGRGTPAQVDVVLANSALALQCARPELSWDDALATARESLESKKALGVLKKLLSI